MVRTDYCVLLQFPRLSSYDVVVGARVKGYCMMVFDFSEGILCIGV